MYRIDNSSAVPNMPLIGPPGTPGFFTDGNAAAALEATIVDAWWANAVQEEIVNVINAAGITLRKDSVTQLWEALETLYYRKGSIDLSGYLPLTGGTLFNGGSDPLTIQSAPGAFARIRYTNPGVRLWSAGVSNAGNFIIVDESAGRFCLTIGPDGGATFANNLDVPGTLHVGGAVSIGGYSLMNDGAGSLYSVSRFRAGSMATEGGIDVGGTVTIGGLPLYNDGTGSLYVPAKFRAASLQIDGNGEIAGSISIGGLALGNDGTNALYSPAKFRAGELQIDSNAAIALTLSAQHATVVDGIECQRIQAVNVGYGTHEAGHFEVNDGGRDAIRVINNAGGQLVGFFFPNYHEVGSITSDGNTISVNNPSDIRLKTDVEPLAADYAGLVLAALRPIAFRWKSEPGGERCYGFAAQELQTVFPQAVIEGRGAPDDEDFRAWGVDPSKLVPVMVSAIQQLTARLEAMEARL